VIAKRWQLAYVGKPRRLAHSADRYSCLDLTKELLRACARKILEAVVETEIEAFVESVADEKGEAGGRQVVRNRIQKS
jgi:hypothetical protein